MFATLEHVNLSLCIRVSELKPSRHVVILFSCTKESLLFSSLKCG